MGEKTHSAFSRMADRHRPEVNVTAGQNAALEIGSGQLGCRGSEPARSTTIAKGLPCYGRIIQNFSDGRQAPCGGHCNRSTNSATAKNSGDSPEEAADGEIPALFVGIDASLYGEGAEGVVRLDDDLVDGAELLVFFEKFELTLEAGELCPECEADCLSGFVNEPQFFFGELVVVDY